MLEIACSLSPLLLQATQFHRKNTMTLAFRDFVGLPSLPEVPLHLCLLANIELTGNVESALLLLLLIFITPCSGFSLLVPQLFPLFPGQQHPHQLQSVPPTKFLSCLVDLNCPAWIFHFLMLPNQH